MTRGAYPRPTRRDVDRDHRQCREDLVGPPVADKEPFERAEQFLVRHAGKRQRPPRDPQLDTERGLLDGVAGHVSDDHRDAMRAGLYGVVEVATEHTGLSAGTVEAAELDGYLLDERMRQQAPLEARGLRLANLRLAQPQRAVLGAPA